MTLSRELGLPLVVHNDDDIARSASNLAEEEPSTFLVALVLEAICVFGISACGLVHCVNAHQKGEEWAFPQIKYMAIAHVVSAAAGLAGLVLVAPQVQRCLKGKWCESALGIEHRWDTVKFTLTMLVSFSHLGLTFYEYAWFSVYTVFKEFFLMQTYFFISGYLSRPEPTRRRLQACWRSLVGAYVVNQIGYFLLTKVCFAYGWATTALRRSWLADFETRSDVMHQNFVLEFWRPIGPLWYLPNLICARLIAPWWLELRWPFATAVVVQCLVLSLNQSDYDDGLAFLSFNWFLTMGLPFYVLGVKARRYSAAINAVLEWKSTWWASCLVMLSTLLACYVSMGNQIGERVFSIYAQFDLSSTNPKRQWFNSNSARLTSSFQTVLSPAQSSKMHTYLTYAWYLVVGGNPLRIVLGLAALRLFSTTQPLRLFGGRLDITAMGKRSISNYLMHWYLLIILQLTWLDVPERNYNSAKIFLCLLIVVAQSMFWMAKPVHDIVRPVFLAPNMDRILQAPS